MLILISSSHTQYLEYKKLIFMLQKEITVIHLIAETVQCAPLIIKVQLNAYPVVVELSFNRMVLVLVSW